MKSVLVLLSTYNGEKYLKEQIDSVLGQEKVKTFLLVRDDGSTDKTCSILEWYQKRGALKWYNGKNLGPARSFVDLIFHSKTDFDYYAFCDQDDFWKPDKLYLAIQKMESDLDDIPKICYCNLELVDADKRHLETKKLYKRCEYFEEMILTYCVPGCAMVFNNKLLCILQKHKPNNLKMHDCWIYYTCVAVGGRIYGDDNVGIQYRQHGNNVIGASKVGLKKKIGMILGNGTTPRQNMIEEILYDFNDELVESDDLRLLRSFSKYSHSLKEKFKIMFIKRKISPRRSFVKAKLRVLFNSL